MKKHKKICGNQDLRGRKIAQSTKYNIILQIYQHVLFYRRNMAKKNSFSSVNLHDLVLARMDEYFTRTAKPAHKKLDKKGLIGREVDWKRVRVEQLPVTYNLSRISRETPRTSTLFQTTFTNRTANTQKYTFSTERTTRSCCEVSLERSVTRGAEFSIGLALPDEIVSANAGFKREETIGDSASQTIEHELMWSVDSEVEVGRERKATARVVITEDEHEGPFEAITRMKGVVRVIYTNLKDNNSLLTTFEDSIENIVRSAVSDGRVDASTCRVSEGHVECVMSGKYAFHFGVRQDIEIEEHPLAAEASNCE